MIIINCKGGLGNQMFQYAAAKSLALFKKEDFKIDNFWYRKNKKEVTNREFQLNIFDCDINFANKKDLNKFFFRIPFLCSKKIRKDLLFKDSCIYNEQSCHYDKNFFLLPKDVYLMGYFQSEKYFKNFEESIRRDFNFKTEQTGKNKMLSNLTKKTNSVSVHIRRGDYITNKKANAEMEICGLEYYNNCINRINKIINKPYYFVFSDDIEWAKKNLKLNNSAVYVDHNTGDNAFEDMRLMSQCKHNIIANSSFSWWGAWLNDNPSKIVIAPKKWFKKKSERDLIPDSWRRV